ncbi:hypothetical protein F4780DRAFT_755618 [Xylariomycetidae sp. FL0641]|nr:hypothetical protein F4780DRAFT_755618 [Xylariomycetidae sp. FL0641]
MDPPQCTGSPTFNTLQGGAFAEWPANLPGIICKTPPVGAYRAERFARCCSGPVYNVTAPTAPDDAAYPVSCAALCQVAPEFDAPNDANPYGWSDSFMCLTDGGRDTAAGEIVCGTVSVPGVPMPSSFASTPDGAWATPTWWTTDSWGRWDTVATDAASAVVDLSSETGMTPTTTMATGSSSAAHETASATSGGVAASPTSGSFSTSAGGERPSTTEDVTASSPTTGAAVTVRRGLGKRYLLSGLLLFVAFTM